MSRRKLAVVGNGMAGVKCVEEILDLAPDRFEITIIGNEPYPNYNRILLSKVLQGNSSIKDIVLNDWDWYEQRGIRLLTGVAATHIRTRERLVETSAGESIPYDDLILATGSEAFIPPINGVDKEGVTVFRSVEDCENIMKAAERCAKAVVIGGGLLGLEAARGLLHLGLEVEVVHNASHILNRQLDPIPSEMLRNELERQGIRFLLEKRTQKVLGRTRAEGLLFSDGTRTSADLVVLSVGIRPRAKLAAVSGIRTNMAIVVDDYMQTSVPNIYAVGECAEHRGIAYGLVAPLFEQGKVLARRLCGADTAPYRGSTPAAQLKISGIDLYSVGDIHGGQTALQMVDAIKGTYKRVVMTEGKVVGAVLYGDIKEAAKWRGLVERSADVSALPPLNGAEKEEANAADALSGSDIVCVCNGVCKSAIVEAVRQDGLTTLEQVKAKTKASGSCGGCRPVVEAVLERALAGAGEEETVRETVCGCSDHSHDDLRMIVAEAKQGDMPLGCGVCRGAVRYYSGLSAVNRSRQTLPLPLGESAGRAFGTAVHASAREDSADEQERSAYELGKRIETALDGLPMPQPVVFRLSPGPGRPAGVPAGSFGISGTPAGWELYAGGHAELPLRQSRLVAFESSAEALLQIAIACLQWYRETADWGEAAWRWMERLGEIAVREYLLDVDNMEQLIDRWAEDRKWKRATAYSLFLRDSSEIHA